MTTQLRSVTCAGVGKKRRPRVTLYLPWITDMGFTPEALVQVLPEENGMAFTLCNEKIKKYSELLKATKEKGGELVHVYLADDPAHKGPAIAASGKYVRTSGLDIGDPFVARYDYGLIRIRKLPDIANVKFIPATSIREKRTGMPVPKVTLCGDWLSGIGFIPDALVIAAAEPGIITFKLQDNDISNHTALVKYARQNKAKLLQVRKQKQSPIIGMTGQVVDRAGFAPDDVFIADYEYGTIKLRKLDFKQLGF